MANIDELLEQASEIRDANEEKENTALRVGKMFIDLIQYMSGYMTDEQVTAAIESFGERLAEYLSGYARLNEKKTLVDWDQLPVVPLATMGSLDYAGLGTFGVAPAAYTPQVGDLYFLDRSGYQIHEKLSSGSTGRPARVGVLYVNIRSGRTYRWDGSAMVETVESIRYFAQLRNTRVLKSLHVQDYNSMTVGDVAYDPIEKKIVAKLATSYFRFDPDPEAIYCDLESGSVLAWGASEQTWKQVGSTVDIINNLTTGGATKALSAEQGKELKAMIDELTGMIDEIGDGGSTVSIEGDALVITDNTSPVLHMVPSVVHFGDTLLGQTATATVSVSGKRLTGNVTIGLTGSGFTANKQTLTPDADGNLTDTIIITFAPTGSGEDVEFTGLLTATHDGVQMASVEISGTGVAEIVPRVEVKMNGDDVSAIALKGVLSSTAEGDYTDEPSKATLRIKAKNIENGVTLELTGGTKFALSKSSLTAEEALAGADIVVSYNRQDAVTQTDDTDTLTISCQDLQGDITIQVSGATGEKTPEKTGNTYNSFTAGDFTYQYTYVNNAVHLLCEPAEGKTITGALILNHVINDEYGYLYNLDGVLSEAFKNNSGITSLHADSGVSIFGSSAFNGCSNLASIVCDGELEAKASAFNGCSSLTTIDCESIKFSGNLGFYGTSSLSSVTVHSNTASVGMSGSNLFASSNKTLYVPSSLVATYQADAVWSNSNYHFTIQAITE